MAEHTNVAGKYPVESGPMSETGWRFRDAAQRLALSCRVMTGQTTELPRIGSPGSGLGDSWRVIVRNDNHNTFDHVARTLARYIPATTLERGYELANLTSSRP